MANILLIDDDELVRELFSEVLEAFGHSVTTAADGDEGIMRFDASIEVVITDMNMPRRNGLEVVTILREKVPGLPVIIMSGHVGQSGELARFALKKEPNRLLAKPFAPELLHEIVTRLLAPAIGDVTETRSA